MTEPSTNREHIEHAAATAATEMFEPGAWDERYSGSANVWSGSPNPQLVTAVSALTPGTALDVGCGEGGDVIWLAHQGWTVTGADFSRNGLARAARHAEQAGVAEKTSWWQVDARSFEAQERRYDLVTTHFLHPREGTMVDVVRRLADAVSPGGHLLVVGHAPPAETVIPATDPRRKAMFLAEQLLPALPDDFEPLVVEQRPRSVIREGRTIAAVDALEVDAGDAEVGVSELALDHYERHAFVRHLDGMSVPQLVGREATSHTGRGSGVMQLLARCRCFPAAACCRSVKHAQQRPDRELSADLEPRVELLPGPSVHPDLATLATLATPDEHRAAGSVQVALLQGERFADAESGAPQQNDQRTKPVTVGTVADCAHDGDDLLDGRWIGGVFLALVTWWAASVVAGHRRSPATMPSSVQQYGFHESSLELG